MIDPNKLPDVQLQDYRWEEGHPIPHIEIEMSNDQAVLWINFNGVCVFRACNLPDGSTTDFKGMRMMLPDKTGFMWQDRQSGELGSIVYSTAGREEKGGPPWRVPVEIRVCHEEPTRPEDSKMSG